MSTPPTIIVGAGPGGLACAARLAGHGHQVLVLEQKPAPGPKVCAGGIPARAATELGLPRELFDREFPIQHVVTPWQRATIAERHPIISTIPRPRLGTWMAQEAIRHGAVLRSGCHVTAVDEGLVRLGRETLRCHHLVGADGSGSLVRRRLGLSSRFMGAGVHFEVPGDFPHMEWHLEPDLFGSGYAWIFPFQGWASVGAYAERTHVHPARLLAGLVRWAANRGIPLHGLRPRAALVNADHQGLHFGQIHLVGDAAGLASGFTGEGISAAILSGWMVADSIAGSPADGRLARLLVRQRQHHRLQRLFARPTRWRRPLMELIVLALRLRLLDFRLLELA